MIIKRVDFHDFTIHEFLFFEMRIALIQFCVESSSKIHSFIYIKRFIYMKRTFLKYLFQNFINREYHGFI